MISEQTQVRLNKLDIIKEAGIHPYPERFEINQNIAQVREREEGEKDVRIAGRITAIRKMGNLTFCSLSDITGRMQIALNKKILEDQYNVFHKIIDVGDFIGAVGEVFFTQTGEKTIRVSEYQFLGKCYHPLPEKWHGITDKELCYRKRYLDLIMNDESRQIFMTRAMLIRNIRRYLDDRSFLEVETPILCNKASGALATPFVTHHNALDIPLYLRIAPETYLKRCIVSGYNNVYEVARCFRNEGISAQHLQDFTMIEGYSAYWNYEDNMEFLREMLQEVIQKTFGTLKITFGESEIDLSGKWPKISFRDLILKDSNIDIDQFEDAPSLLAEIKNKGIILEADNVAQMGRGNLIDQLYKKVSRPQMTSPQFLTSHPLELSPLARSNDDNPHVTDRFQLVIAGAEIINGYSELVDPYEQFKRLDDQAKLNAQGDDDAMVMDQDYILAMEHGMPPISGWGMGIDRLMMLLLNQENVKNTVLFPLMRPQEINNE